MSWQNLNWADYTILGIIGFSTLISLIRGFVREALSLIIWVGAFWIAYRYATPFAQQFLKGIQSEGMKTPVSFGILFLGVLILGALLNYIMSRLVSQTGLSGTDRVLGLVFGMGRGVFLVAVVALVVPMTAVNKSTWWQESQLVPEFEGLALYLHGMLPAKMDQIPLLSDEKKDLAQVIVNQSAAVIASSATTASTVPAASTVAAKAVAAPAVTPPAPVAAQASTQAPTRE